MNDDYPTSIRLPAKLRADLLKAAKDDDRSLVWLIRHILTQWCEWREKQQKVEQKREPNTASRSAKRP